MSWSRTVARKTIVAALALGLAGCADGASAQVVTDSRGEQVIATRSVRPSVHRTDIVRWLCVDPVEVAIEYTLRETGEMSAASISVRIANIPARRDASEEIMSLANKPMFKIYGLCNGDRPIALVSYAEALSEIVDGSGSATILSRSIYLRDPAPLVE